MGFSIAELNKVRRKAIANGQDSYTYNGKTYSVNPSSLSGGATTRSQAKKLKRSAKKSGRKAKRSAKKSKRKTKRSAKKSGRKTKRSAKKSGRKTKRSGKKSGRKTKRSGKKSGRKSRRKPCKSGQKRNPKTGRCRKTSRKKTPKKPCKKGQRRSRSTGRCRKISSKKTAKKPCKDGKTRDRRTGRCSSKRRSSKLVASTGRKVTGYQLYMKHELKRRNLKDLSKKAVRQSFKNAGRSWKAYPNKAKYNKMAKDKNREIERKRKALRSPKKLTAWNRFVKAHMRSGVTFKQLAKHFKNGSSPRRSSPRKNKGKSPKRYGF